MHHKKTIELISQQIVNITFSEHPVKDCRKEKAGKYDVTTRIIHQANTDFKIDGKFAYNTYCKSLFVHLFTFSKPERRAFFDYQFSLLKSPLDWIEEVEELLKINEALVHETDISVVYKTILSEVIHHQTILRGNQNELSPDISQKENTPSIYNLPEGVKLTSLGIKVDKLDIYQSAILFHVLRKQGLILNYSDKDLSKFAHSLTGHSESNIRQTKGFGAIYDLMTQERKGVKGYNTQQVIQTLEETINYLKSEIE